MNGLAVQIMKKSQEGEGTMASRIAKVLMAYRTTPQSTIGVSTSELLQGWKIHTRLDLLKPSVTERVEQHRVQQKLSHDTSARRRSFMKGETVYAVWYWREMDACCLSGYHWTGLRLQDGRIIRRHQDHLRYYS